MLVYEDKPIRILTYNMYLRGPFSYKNYCEEDYKYQRIVDFRFKARDYDIVCFQEVFGSLSFRREELIRRCKDEGLKYSNFPPTQSCLCALLTSCCPILDGGLLITSRFPIVESSSIQYRDNPINGDFTDKKGVQYCAFNINDQIIYIFNTHTQFQDLEIYDTSKTSVKQTSIIQLNKR